MKLPSHHADFDCTEQAVCAMAYTLVCSVWQHAVLMDHTTACHVLHHIGLKQRSGYAQLTCHGLHLLKA